jgi:hypothetical protein
LLIDPATGSILPQYATGSDSNIKNLGNPIVLGGSLANTIKGSSAVSVGLISSAGTAESFQASWDYMEIESKDTILGVPDNSLKRVLKLYPNPTSNELYLTSALPLTSATISVLSVTGQLVGMSTITNIESSTKIPVDFSKVPRGVYLVQIIAGELAGTYRIVKL